MEEKKEGRRKSAKEMDYNLLLLCAQTLQEAVSVLGMGTSGGWLGRTEDASRRMQTCCTFFWGGHILSEILLVECAGMTYHPQDSLPSHTASASLSRDASVLWDLKWDGARGLANSISQAMPIP